MTHGAAEDLRVLAGEGLRRYCRHSCLQYLGSHAERHLWYDTVFMLPDKEARTRAFARQLLQML